MVLFRPQPLSTKSSYLPSCTIHTDQTLSSILRSFRLCLFAVYEFKSSSVCISSMPMVCTNAKASIHECTDRRITFTKFSLMPSYSNSTKHLPIYPPTAYLSLQPLKSFSPRFLQVHSIHGDCRRACLEHLPHCIELSLLDNHFCALRLYKLEHLSHSTIITCIEHIEELFT